MTVLTATDRANTRRTSKDRSTRLTNSMIQRAHCVVGPRFADLMARGLPYPLGGVGQLHSMTAVTL